MKVAIHLFHKANKLQVHHICACSSVYRVSDPKPKDQDVGLTPAWLDRVPFFPTRFFLPFLFPPSFTSFFPIEIWHVYIFPPPKKGIWIVFRYFGETNFQTVACTVTCPLNFLHFTVALIPCFVFRFCYVILTLFRWFQLFAEPRREAGQNLRLKFLTGLTSWWRPPYERSGKKKDDVSGKPHSCQ